MSEELESDGEDRELKPLAIEGKLPLKAVGIENLKEDNPKHMPPHRYLLPWFARRPTPAARLAVIGSVLPKDSDRDTILEMLQIGPRGGGGEEIDIEEYVERKKATEGGRSGTLEDHYGYPRPFTQTPSPDTRDKLHTKLRDYWDDELPTVLDPTAGGGVIPLESLRYGLPIEANELNSVPSLILKSVLDYPLSIGHLRSDLERWGREIDASASTRLEQFFPKSGSKRPSHYAGTYVIDCPACGCDIPLVPSWWLLKRSASDGIAVKPSIENNSINYQQVSVPEDISDSNFNPQDGPRSRGGNVECVNCGIVTEGGDVKQRLREGDYEYEILGAKYVDGDGNSEYRVPTDADYAGIEAATERIENDINLYSFLDTEIPESGQKTAEPVGYGMEEWRDMFTPRQLVSHYEYLKAYEEIKERIRTEYSDERRIQAILTLLSFAAGKMVDRNSRVSPYSINRGYPENLFGGKNFGFQWLYVDNNPAQGDQSYIDTLTRIVDSYKEIVSYVESVDVNPVDVQSGDAASLPFEDESVQSVVVDPPYYSSIMYSELSDMLYVWLREYLDDVHPELFESELTEKSEEAVANPAKFDNVSNEERSKRELAKDDYEQKMSDIFSELYRVTDPGGVLTVMFTHKETDAWDTLTSSLIKSGFIITATHPITSEMPYRMDVRGGGATESTLLLVGRKPYDESARSATQSLWTDVKRETRNVATSAARDLLDSGLSLTKTDVIISAFGPTLRVYADAYPVVDDQDNEVPPRRALEEAREAVTRVLVEEFLAEDGMEELDDVTEWYVLCWLVHESAQFDFDDGLQLGYGVGIDIEDIKRDTKVWRKRRGDIALRSHDERVQDIETKRENRSSRTPVDPDALSFARGLDAVHAAMHVYDVRGEAACVEWLRERNLDTDARFESTLRALLQVLPRDHDDWGLARDLAVGRTREVLDLDFGPEVFGDRDEDSQSDLDDFTTT